jgi:UDP-hydrolysing UDP-N-acetyl-D-glucosamine 2-epimerase
MMSNKRKIAIVTGSRGEYGYIRPIIKKILQEPSLDYELIVTNMHLLSEYGNSISEIERDGFKIGAKHHMTLDGYTNTTMTKSLGIFLLELPETLDRVKPDIILIAGDRGEQLMAAIAGAHLNIPVAHIQAGEVSGNIDGIVRHAITKLSHIHFVDNEDCVERVRKLGEQEFRIFLTGAPQLDELVEAKYSKPKELAQKYGLNLNKPIILAVQHPVTEEFNFATEQITETLLALREINEQTIIVYPNADAGNKKIKEMINTYSTPSMRAFRNLPREDYLGLMRIAKVIVGNSSSAIIEATFFALPAVNIGTRQHGRKQGDNVINTGYDKNEIVKAILTAMSHDFRSKLVPGKSPYGDGHSAERIVKILKKIEIDEKLIKKKITY